jgi:Arc/MetJ-type ribon-helix-helix transcriptional regulator
MVVTLSPELEDLVRELVSTGGYRSEDEVVAYALKRLALDAALDEGEADLREGRFITISNEEELAAFFADL